MDDFIRFLKGFAMGAANVIPGVSGGTIAFITRQIHTNGFQKVASNPVASAGETYVSILSQRKQFAVD